MKRKRGNDILIMMPLVTAGLWVHWSQLHQKRVGRDVSNVRWQQSIDDSNATVCGGQLREHEEYDEQ